MSGGRPSPLISIITPYRNSEHFLPGLAANLQAQTYPHWECLLINHHSNDRGPAMAVDLANRDPRFRPIEERDARPLPALPRNTGVGHARGELICFLDVDDLWHPAKLERQLMFHTGNNLEFSVTSYGRFRPGPEVETAGDVWRSSENVLPRRWRPRHPPALMSQRRLLWDNPIPMLTVMLNNDLLQWVDLPAGPFGLIHHEDYLLWLTLWSHRPSPRYGCLHEVLAFHRRHSSNITGARWRMLAWTYRVYRAHGNSVAAAAFRSARHSCMHAAMAASSAFSFFSSD